MLKVDGSGVRLFSYNSWSLLGCFLFHFLSACLSCFHNIASFAASYSSLKVLRQFDPELKAH